MRNLTAAEIVGQIMVARDDLGDWGRKPDEKRLVSNLVLMGMGEPLYNFDAVRDAMKIAMDGEGIALSRRRITLSTSGVVPEIARVGEEIGCLLAISFHATTDAVRDALVPINRKWNIAALLDACRAYPRLSNAERITFEYVMLKGVNDSDADARRLVKLIAGIPAKINLIPFNPWPGAPYERSDPDRIEAFGAIVNRAGYASPVRTPRGEDIMAACGQLKSASERVRRVRAISRSGRRSDPPLRRSRAGFPNPSRLGVYQPYQAEMGDVLKGAEPASNDKSRHNERADMASRGCRAIPTTTGLRPADGREQALDPAERPGADRGLLRGRRRPGAGGLRRRRRRRAPTTSSSPRPTGCWR